MIQITKTNLLERIIHVEEKLDLLADRNAKNVHRFNIFVYWIFLLLVINIVLHVLIMLRP